MTAYHIAPSDAIEWATAYDGEPFHALLCDPPYELGFMGKRWDKSGVPFRPETWAAFARVLHDGAFGMAFASSRGWHRLACAIEDAGFIIHPSIFGWGFGSGFPKATRIDTQIDKAAGAEREVVATGRQGTTALGKGCAYENGYRPNKYEKPVFDITSPATPMAATWQGHRYGLQALKPALEPIIVFQKPYRGKPVDCITATGAGAFNVDGGRINVSQHDRRATSRCTHGSGESRVYCSGWGDNLYGKPIEYHPLGRWPANFIVSHSPACVYVNDNGHSHWECGEGCAVKALDGQSGDLGVSRGGNSNAGSGMFKFGDDKDKIGAACGFGDSGGASRFFYNVSQQIDDADPVCYCAKASRKERDAGLDDMRMRDGRELSGGGGIAHPKADTYQARKVSAHNPHPTIKPLSLTRYLATLLLPPAEYAQRRLFVPFAGVASEMIGALQAGWDFVQGVEMEAEYAEIAEARLKHYIGVFSEEVQK